MDKKLIRDIKILSSLYCEMSQETFGKLEHIPKPMIPLHRKPGALWRTFSESITEYKKVWWLLMYDDNLNLHCWEIKIK
jgi:hypothetical protein